MRLLSDVAWTETRLRLPHEAPLPPPPHEPTSECDLLALLGHPTSAFDK